MNSHCRVEEEIPRSSHGPGVVALQRKPPAPALGREKGLARGEPPEEAPVLFHVYLPTHCNEETSFQHAACSDRFLNPSQCFTRGAVVKEEIMGISSFL